MLSRERTESRADVSPRSPSRSVAGRSPELLLIGVSVVFLAVQLVVVGVGRASGFDEAIYLSEVMPGAESISWAAHRSMGIVGFIWPPAQTDSLLAVRTWLAVTSAIGLWLAYRPWTRTIGHGAPLAAAVFASGWGVAFYGSEVYPNLQAALATVAAVGFAVAAGRTGRWTSLVGLGLSVAVIAAMRPVDVVWVLASLGVLLLVTYRWRGVGIGVVAGLGAALGWVLWVVEAYRRFDGPVQRLRGMSGSTLDVAVTGRVSSYLDILDGPMAAQASRGYIAPASLVVVGVIAVLTLIGASRRVGDGDLAGVRIAALCAIGVLVPYVVLTDAVYIRFVLSAWGLAAIAFAQGLRRLGGQADGGLATSLLGVAAVAWLGWQMVLLGGLSAEASQSRQRWSDLSEVIAERVERPCYVFVEGDYPAVGINTGCTVGWYRPDADDAFRHDPAGRAAKGYTVYALTDETDGPAADWPSEPIEQVPGWRLARLPQ